jgi:hypothetical protein
VFVAFLTRGLGSAATVLVATLLAGGCGGEPSEGDRWRETAVLNDLTQEQVTARVLDYARIIGTRLPDGARMQPDGVAGTGPGTLNCHHGRERTGLVFVRSSYSIEDLAPTAFADVLGRLRDSWTAAGYQVLDDTHFQDGDRILRVGTDDDYHLTVRTYGGDRDTPLVVVESPCAWPS